MNKLKLLCLAPLWLASIISATNVEGSIEWNFKCQDLKALHPQTKVVLDGGRYRASIGKDGHFTLYNVPPGSYLLEVLARDHEFDPLRVEVLPSISLSGTSSNPSESAHSVAHTSTTATAGSVETAESQAPFDVASDEEPPLVPIPSAPSSSHDVSEKAQQQQQQVEVEVRPAPPGTPFHPAGSPHLQALPLLPYPIVLSTKGQKIYDVPQKGFDVLEMFKNPMMLMMLVAGALIFVLPKVLENMDPDMVKDMRERQDKMFNLQSSIQNGDFGALKAELTQRTSDPSASKPRASGSSSAPMDANVAGPQPRLVSTSSGNASSGKKTNAQGKKKR